MSNLPLGLEEIHNRVSELDYSTKSNSVSGAGVWTSLFSKSLDENIPKDRIRVVKYLTARYQKVVAEARRNKINLSQQFLKEIEQTKVDLSNEEEQLVKVFALPAKAYLFYKQSLYNDALKATIDTTIIDEHLEECGFPILHYHRIQQLQNICRIYFKMNDIDTAIRTSNELLRYLMTGQSPYLLNGTWRINLLELAPADLRSAMIFQIMQEMHSICIRLSDNSFDKQRSYHTEIFSGLDDFTIATSEDNTMMSWLKVKTQFYCGNYNDFIKISLNFLHYESNQFDFFKYFLVKDMLHVFSDLKETHEIIPIVEALNTYAEVKLRKKDFFISSIIN